jgi:hypothetical protein
MRRSGYARCKAGSHTIWDCKHHIVWITRCWAGCRAKARELLREIARSHEMTICAGSINRTRDTAACVGVSGRGRVTTSLCRSINRFASAIGVNISGAGAIGSLPAATSLTRYGRSTLRIRNRRFRMITSTSYSKSALAVDRIWLLAVFRESRVGAAVDPT